MDTVICAINLETLVGQVNLIVFVTRVVFLG